MADPAARAAQQRGENPPAYYILRSEQPQVYLSWGSKMPACPDRLKLRKEVKLWPLKFTLKADYETRSRDFTYGISCKVGAASCRLLAARFLPACPPACKDSREPYLSAPLSRTRSSRGASTSTSHTSE